MATIVSDLNRRADALERIAATHPSESVRRRAHVELVRVGRAMQAVGDAAQDLARELVELREEALAFRWPSAVIEWAEEQHDPEMQRRIYRAARESAFRDVDRRITRARDALRDGDLVSARHELNAARARWRAFLQSANETAQDAHRGTRNVLRRWADYVDDSQRDAERAFDDLTDPDSLRTVGLMILAGLAAFALLR